MSLGTLTVGLRGNYGGLARDMRKGEGIVSGSVGRMRGMIKSGLALTGIGGVVASALAGAGIGAAVNAELNKVDATSKLADQLGIGTKALVGLEHAAGLAGASAGTLERSMEGMLKRLGQAATKGGAPAEALAMIGLNAQELSQLKPEEAFKRLAEEIGKAEDPARRAFLANELFGRSGQDLLPMFMNGRAGIEAAASEAERLGIAFDRTDGAKVEAANDAMARMKATAIGVARQVTIAAAPALTRLAQAGTELGAKVVSAVRTVLPPIVSVASRVGSAVFGFLGSAAGRISAMWVRLRPTVLPVLSTLGSVAAGVGSMIVSGWSMIEPVVGGIAVVVGSVVAGVGGMAAVAGIGTLIAGAVGAAVTVVAGLAGTVVTVAAAAAPFVAVAGAIALGIGGIIAAAGGIGPILEAGTNAWNATYGFVRGVVVGIASTVSERWNSILGTITSVGTAVLGVVSAAFGAVWSVVSTVGRGLAMAWTAAMGVLGISTASTADGTSSAFGRIVDAVQWVADTVTFGANVFSFALGNIGTIADYATTTVAYNMTRLANEVEHGFWVGVEYAKWFGTNFTTLIGDSMRLGWTIASNGVANVVRVVSNLPGLIAGTTEMADIWTPLTEGFEARVGELPEIAERVPGALESAFAADRLELGNQLNADFAQHLEDQQHRADAAAGKIGSALDGLSGMIGGVETPEVEEIPQPEDPKPIGPLASPEYDVPEIPEPVLGELPTPENIELGVDVKMPELIGIGSAREQMLRYALPMMAGQEPEQPVAESTTPDPTLGERVEEVAQPAVSAVLGPIAGLAVDKLPIAEGVDKIAAGLGGFVDRLRHGGNVATADAPPAFALLARPDSASPGHGVSFDSADAYRMVVPDAPQPRTPKGVRGAHDDLARQQLAELRKQTALLKASSETTVTTVSI